MRGNLENRFDVAVIGAGAAGLAAAAELRRSGLSVALIEARDRLGGRVHSLTTHAAALPIELGAEFIHGFPDASWSLLNESRLTAYRVPDQHRFLRQRGKLEEMPDFWKKIEKVFSRMKTSGSKDRTFAQYLSSRRLSTGMKSLAVSFVEGFHAASIDRVSEFSLARIEKASSRIQGERVHRVLEGYGSLLDSLWTRSGPDEGCFLNTCVSEIHWRKGEVLLELKTPQGFALPPLRSSQAIVTLPVGVLREPAGRSGAVSFHPALPEKEKALRGLEMGPVSKVVLRFRRSFWEGRKLDSLGFVHAPGAAFPVWWDSAPVRAPLLTGWAGGPAAQALSFGEGRGVLVAALESLSQILGVDRKCLLGELEAWHFHDWQADPFSRGAYSFVVAGGVGSQERLAKPVENTLFFAGEATQSDGLGGTVDGALESGIRSGREILATRGSRQGSIPGVKRTERHAA